MKWFDRSPSLGKLIFLRIFAVNLTVIFVLSLFLFLHDFLSNSKRLHQSMQETIESNTPLISESLWLLDQKQLAMHLNRLFANPNVQKIVLSEEKGYFNQSLNRHLVPFKFVNFFKTKKDLVYQGQKIGEFSIVYNDAQLWHEMLTNLSFALSIIITLSFFFYLYFKWVISKNITAPLHSIILAITDIDPHIDSNQDSRLIKNIPEDLILSENELGNLCRQVRQLELVLIDSNQRIKDYSNNLEKRIDERTFELLDSQIQLQRALEIKGQFLANVSHEIRTPLNGIMGLNTLLKDTSLNDQQKRIVSDIENVSSNLLALINDILDFSKIEAGKFTLTFRPFNLRECIRSLKIMFEQNMLAKGLKFDIHINDQVPAYIINDEVRLKQVLINLLSNAHKFTLKGSVTLVVDSTELSDQTHDIIFSVKDTGIGIAEEKISDLFTPFEQVDVSNTRKIGGTGLGLSISKSIVEMMNGHIWARSEEGQGSNFSFNIITEAASITLNDSEPSLEKNQLPTFEHLKVLVAEDNAINMKIITSFLKKLSIIPDTVENGQLAIEACMQKNYDVIFMDMHMPEVDGIEATKAIIGHHGERAPKIIALTANVYEEDRKKCFDAGMCDFITKPFTMKDLETTLTTHFKRS